MNRIIPYNISIKSVKRKNKRKKRKSKLFKKIDLQRNLDQFNSPQIKDCRNMVIKHNYKYDCNISPLDNLIRLNFIECNQIQESNPKWKSLNKGYFKRANLIWDMRKCLH